MSSKFAIPLGSAAAALALSQPAVAATHGHLAIAGQPVIEQTSPSGVEPAHGWKRRSYGHRHGGIDGGDVLAGIMIVGAAAVILNGIRGTGKDRDYRRDGGGEYRERPDYRDDRDYGESDYRERERDYGDRPMGRDSDAIEYAVEDCVNEVEREARVETVDTVERDGRNWMIEGEVQGGDRYRCRVSEDGYVDELRISDSRGAERGKAGDYRRDEQPEPDDLYAARSATPDRNPATPDATARNGTRYWERGQVDDRYETAGGPV